MNYGCVQCYWHGDDAERCADFLVDSFCCPECGYPAYTTEEVQAKMAKLISLYMALLTKLNITTQEQ